MMFASFFSFTVNDVVLQLVPMFHVLGWSMPHAATYVGSKIIFSGKWNLNDVEELTKIMVQEKVSLTGAVPAVFMAMLEFIKKMKILLVEYS